MILLNINYIGEHAFAGALGRTSITVAIIFALASFASYIIYNIKKDKTWLHIGRWTYIFHLLFVVIASGVLFVMLKNHYYEYEYIWKHTANYLPLKFIISAFWAGQEGSFLLWVLMEGILGLILIRTSGKDESHILPTLALGQFMLTTMVWGVKIFGFVIGKSPFLLHRHADVNIGNEFFNDPNYVSMIADGNGINPLLENIWMVTHPPLLFLGYSATIIPFAYVIMALLKKDYDSWLKPAFPWTIFSIITLAGGILLGGAWAYESLTFGGFWAWDPVENASLIPLLFILAGFHMMIINKKRKHSYTLSFLFIILGFVLVMYASYLTRSGVLSSTSAHAFGNNGLSAQMVIIIVAALVASTFLYFKNIKYFPKLKTDTFLSREFWMYLGAIVMVLSAFQVFATTSIPVFNTVFGTSIAPPNDVIGYYNKWQLPFAILIIALIGGSLILRYGKNDLGDLNKRLFWILGISTFLYLPSIFVFEVTKWQFLLFLFFLVFSLVSSVGLIVWNKRNTYFFANSLSHFGFTLFLLGVLVSFSNSKTISSNTTNYDLGDSETNSKNQVLVKHKPMILGPYLVNYRDYKYENNHLYYTLDFYNAASKRMDEPEFTIEPTINVNGRMGNVYNPDTRHTLSRDVFTYITYANIMEDISGEEYKNVFSKPVSKGDTVEVEGGKLIFSDLKVDIVGDTFSLNDISISASFVHLPNGGVQSDSLKVKYLIRDGKKSAEDAMFLGDTFKLRFENVSSSKDEIMIGLDKKRLNYIVISSTIFPWISLLAIGALIMFAGLITSFFRHLRQR